MNYLKTGAYQAWSPFGKDITFQEPDGRPGCDFFGVNHYARCPTYHCIARVGIL